MKPKLRYGLLALGAIDLLLGTLLLVWPGVWQEGVHPWAMGTVFYPIQRLGAAWLGRALLTVVALRSGRSWLFVLAGAWALDIPGDLLLAWRVADTGPWVVWIYVGHALVCAWAVHWLYRAAREE